MGEAVLINVCGAQRAGTTMLDAMLGSTDAAFSCGETFAWYRPWTMQHLRIDCPCGQDPCPQWERIKDYPEADFHRGVADELAVDRVVDSSKNVDWIEQASERAAEREMRIASVVIWKDPLELTYSWWKRGWLGSKDGIPDNPGTQAKFASKIIADFSSYHRDLFETGLPLVGVNYGSLVADPPRLLAQVCDALSIPYLPGQERFWLREQHLLFGSHSVRVAVERGTAEIRASVMKDEFVEISPPYMDAWSSSAEAEELIAELRRISVGSAS